MHENTSDRLSYEWFDEDQLNNVAMVRHSPSSESKLNYLQHDKLNAPISAAIISEQRLISSKSKVDDNENIFLIIVPVTIGMVIAIKLYSLINYLKKVPNVPNIDLTDQCLIVQQIKPNVDNVPKEQNLIANPLADENLDIDTILNSTIKLSKVPLYQSNQVIKSNAQLDEIYYPVVKGTHSHLLIKPTNSVCYSAGIANEMNTNYLNEDVSQTRPNPHYLNLGTFYLNNKAQLDYEQHSSFVSPVNWSVNNCCETCPCNQQHRSPD